LEITQLLANETEIRESRYSNETEIRESRYSNETEIRESRYSNEILDSFCIQS